MLRGACFTLHSTQGWGVVQAGAFSPGITSPS